MTDERGTLRRIDWQELCPWLLILKSFRLAVGIRVLVLAFAGLLIATGGWWALGEVFSKGEDKATNELVKECSRCPFESENNLVGTKLRLGTDGFPETATSPEFGPITRVWHDLSRPFVRLFRIDLTFVQLAFLVLGGVWSVAVWSVFGGAIARISALALTREDRVGIRAALAFALRKWMGFVLGPLFPFVGVLLATIPLFVLGLLFRMDFALVLSVILWPLVLAAGAFLAILMLGLFFGWPLMWGTIATEGTDAFDSLSRSYNYIRERPLHYLFYIAVAAAFGLIGGWLVDLFTHSIVNFGTWAISWGMGSDRLREINADSAGFSHRAIHFWNSCVLALGTAFMYGFFFSAMTAVYLLMRLKVDAMELDEVFTDEEEQSYSMPPLTTDAANVPKVADAPPVDENKKNDEA